MIRLRPRGPARCLERGLERMGEGCLGQAAQGQGHPQFQGKGQHPHA